ncbi:MAG: hypothetical protein ACHQJ6_01150 [Candidatus Berkiellales bacterium]
MRQLNDNEVLVVNGGIFNFAASALIGYAVYALKKDYQNEPKTLQGALTAAGFGGVTGGLGGLAAEAAGGGMIGSLAWKPGFTAINMAGQAIATKKK